MSCDFADRDGSYVLGALSPVERLEFEQHLAGCPDCSRSVRELAGLPGLLARVDATVLESAPVQEPLPRTLLPALQRQVRRTRRRRVLVTGGLVAAAVAVAVVPVALPLVGDGPASDRTPSATPAFRAMVPVGHAPVRASLSLARVTWGTRLDLTCTYGAAADKYREPPAVTYALFVRTREGDTEQVGTWRSLEGRTMRLTAATAVPRRDIASVEVRTADGQPVLELLA